MIKKFFISKKLDEFASKVEKNAEKEADSIVEGVKEVLGSTEYVGLILQVCASAYRLLRVALTIIVTDTPEGKAFRELLIEFEKAFAKRLRASSGFVTTLTKNKKVMRAIEAFEEDWEELKEVILQREKSKYHEKIDSLVEQFGKLKGKKAGAEKAFSTEVLKARTYIAEVNDIKEFDTSIEAEARIRLLQEFVKRAQTILTLRKIGLHSKGGKDLVGERWIINDGEDDIITLTRKISSEKPLKDVEE